MYNKESFNSCHCGRSISFSVNIVWPVNIIVAPNGKGCILYMDKRDFIYEIWFKVDSSIFVFIPMIIIFLCNIMIICRLQQSTKRHHQMTQNDVSIQKREKEQRKTTIILLSVSIAFLLLHTPYAVYNCLAMVDALTGDQEAYAKWTFFNYFGMTTAGLQNSVNFFLYFLSGRRYRRTVCGLFIAPFSLKTCRNIANNSIAHR